MVGMGFGLGRDLGIWEKKKHVQVLFVLPNSPCFGQQPGYPSFCSQIINFILLLFVSCCLSPTNLTPISAGFGKREKFTPGIGETFPAWKPPPGQNGAFGIEGKKAQIQGILPSLWRPNCPKPLPRTKPWYTKVPLEDSDETCGEWKSVELSNISLDLTPSSSQPLPSALI